MTSPPSIDELFEPASNFPDGDARERLQALVGLDDQISQLRKLLQVLINPSGLRTWAGQYHRGASVIIDIIARRPPLVVLAGDVGTGKTELASTIGDAVARAEDVPITLLPLSLSARGQGRVGEMTRLISAAFEYTLKEATKLISATGPVRGAVLLLIDEADALAQSRELSQMHHEDRAGVNALIRGVDRLASARVPAAVIMCTNRLSALDPAVRRRAAAVLSFSRPDDKQRRLALEPSLQELGISSGDVEAIVIATGPRSNRGYGLTYSDITQRLLPALVLDAYPSGPVMGIRALDIATSLAPTPPFTETPQ